MGPCYVFLFFGGLICIIGWSWWPLGVTTDWLAWESMIPQLILRTNCCGPTSLVTRVTRSNLVTVLLILPQRKASPYSRKHHNAKNYPKSMSHKPTAATTQPPTCSSIKFSRPTSRFPPPKFLQRRSLHVEVVSNSQCNTNSSHRKEHKYMLC